MAARPCIRRGIACAVALAAALAAGDACARSGHGAMAPHHGFHHHHHRFRGFFFVGGPVVFVGVPYTRYTEPPMVYIERFDGEPTPQTEGDIYCPSAGAYYPAVAHCPGGWQRVIRPEG